MTETPIQTATTHPRIADQLQNQPEGLLASERSSLVLRSLTGRATPLSLSELAVLMATEESDLDANDKETIESLKTSLHHFYLPKLDDVGALEYDWEARLIDL